MESGDAGLNEEHQDDARCWDLLPCALQEHCLGSVAQRDKDAVFATSSSFAQALLRTAIKPRVEIEMDRREDSWQHLMGVLQWAASSCKNLELCLRPPDGAPFAPYSLCPLLNVLHEGMGALPTVTRATCNSCALDACPPASLAAVLPNLQQLAVYWCSVPAATLLPLAGLNQLRDLKLTHCRADQQQAWLPQLQLLSSLPSLSSLSIDPREFPTSFLPSLANQLTKLRLRNNRHAMQTDTATWEAALATAAQCTSLRRLKLGMCTAPQLAMLTTLPQLHELILQDDRPEISDSDALISTLLQFSHLTHLTCRDLGLPRQSYADRPCSWKQLTFVNEGHDHQCLMQLLAALPLHSLTQPLQLQELQLDEPRLTVAVVQAAVHNLARSNQQAPLVCCLPCHPNDPAGWSPVSIRFPYRADDTAAGDPQPSHAPLLRAAKPLVCQDITSLRLCQAALNAELVTVLQDVAPCTTILNLSYCGLEPSFWPQLARSFPQLLQLDTYYTTGTCSGADVMGFFKEVIALHAASGQQTRGPRAADITFRWLQLEMQGRHFHEWGLDEVEAAVQQLGLTARVVRKFDREARRAESTRQEFFLLHE